MQKMIGVICVVVGVLLLVWGYQMSQALGSQIEQTFTGAVPDRAMYRYIAGAVLGLFGLFLVFRK